MPRNSVNSVGLPTSILKRYVHPKNLLDSIGTYYASFQWLDNQTELTRLKLDQIHKANVPVFDSYVFHEMMNVRLSSFSEGRTIIHKPTSNPVLLSTDPRDINNVSLSYHYYSTTAKFYNRSLTALKLRAIRLVEQIKKEYPN